MKVKHKVIKTFPIQNVLILDIIHIHAQEIGKIQEKRRSHRMRQNVQTCSRKNYLM